MDDCENCAEQTTCRIEGYCVAVFCFVCKKYCGEDYYWCSECDELICSECIDIGSGVCNECLWKE